MTWRKFIVVLFLGIILRVWWAYSSMPFIDEHAHISYVMYVQEYHKLPDWAMPCALSVAYSGSDNEAVRDTVVKMGVPADAQKILGDVPYSYENYQPPGYYVVAALLDPGVPSGVRLVSIFLFIVAVVVLFRTVRDSGMMYLLLFTPGIIGATTMVGNDVYLFLGSCLLFWACTKRKLWMLVVAGVVLSTAKFHALPILFIVGAYYTYKRDKYWALTALGFFAVALGLTYWRWNLSTVNSIGFIVPTFQNAWQLIAETIGTGIIDTDKGRWSGYMLALAVPIAIYVLYHAYRRWPKLPILNKLVVVMVFGVWLSFSLTHTHWLGRLLYAAIPWFAVTYRGESK